MVRKNPTKEDLTEFGYQVLAEAQDLFKKGKCKEVPVGFIAYATELRNMFPAGKNPSGKVARTNMPEIKKKMIKFFEIFPQYDWNLVLDATELYIRDQTDKGGKYMQTAGYFILKLKDGVQESELANYCEMILEQENNPAAPQPSLYKVL